MKNNGFGYHEKIREKKDFDNLFATGKKSVSNLFVIYACQNNLEFNRLAISIKRHISKAVDRNRMRRIIREIFRLNKKNIFEKQKNDILIISRKNFSEYNYSQIKEELLLTCQKLSQ